MNEAALNKTLEKWQVPFALGFGMFGGCAYLELQKNVIGIAFLLLEAWFFVVARRPMRESLKSIPLGLCCLAIIASIIAPWDFTFRRGTHFDLKMIPAEYVLKNQRIAKLNDANLVEGQDYIAYWTTSPGFRSKWCLVVTLP